VTRYERQIAEALAAVSIRGPANFAWRGLLEPGIAAALQTSMEPAALRVYLCDALRDRLRRSWYCHGQVTPARHGGGAAFVADQALLAALRAANTGRGTWQPGWRIERIEDGAAVACDGTLRARIPRADLRMGDGDAAAVRMPKQLDRYAPGFTMILGDADLDRGDQQVRVYWHVTASGAAPLVRMLTRALNGDGVSFECKIVGHPIEFQRADAAVLYLPAAAFTATRSTLLALAAEARPHLRAAVPALTLELAPGVGLAEGTRRAEGFGALRCALLAEAIVRARERAGPSAASVAEVFAEAGVDPGAPYREPAFAGRHVL
jgi:hypothetical protein